MVFLRLEIRVFPREQVSSSPSIFRSLIGSNGDREEASTGKKYVSFLLPLEDPEDVTLADLASMILDEWRMLRPDQEPLTIKKLLDDANPSVDLGVKMSVADVFVDRGKARADGHDQRATVRVIQRPSEHCPQRFGSVVQDWDNAVYESKRRRSRTKKTKQFSPIEEEAGGMDVEEEGGMEDVSMADSPVEHRHRDFPLSSVEIHENAPPSHQEQPSDAAIPGTPPFNRPRSEELGGDSPSPQQQTNAAEMNSRKRKPSPEQDAPLKEPRLEGHTSANQPTPKSPEPTAERRATSTPSPARRRSIPAFASPQHRRPSVSEKPPSPAKKGVGLDVTKSPSGERKAMLDLQSSQSSLNGSLCPSSAPSPFLNRESVMEKSQSLQSAMRKDTPISKAQQRRSVSFAEANELMGNGPISTPQNTSQLSKESHNTPRSSGTPSGSQIVYPASFSAEKIQKMKEDAEKKFGQSKERAGQKSGKEDDKASASQKDRARKQEEDGARKEEERIRKHEEEKAKREAEKQRKEEEAKRQEEERAREEEQGRREEEAARKQEEAARKQEEAKTEKAANDRRRSRDQNVIDAEEVQAIRDRLRDLDTDSQTWELLTKMLENYGEVEKAKAAGKSRDVRNIRKRIRRLRDKIQSIENQSPPPPDPPLPPSASKVNRSIPTADSAAQGIDTSPSWSFSKPNPNRRPSVISNQSSGSQGDRSASGKEAVDTEAKGAHAPNRSASKSQPSPRKTRSYNTLPSVVIPSPGKRSSQEASSEMESNNSPAKSRRQGVVYVGSDEEESENVEDAEQNADQDGDQDGDQDMEKQQQELGDAPNGVDDDDEEAQEQVQAEMQVDGSAEESAQGSGKESDEELSREPAKQFIDEEAESGEFEDEGSEESEESESESEEGEAKVTTNGAKEKEKEKEVAEKDSESESESSDSDDEPNFNFPVPGQATSTTKPTPNKHTPSKPSLSKTASQPTPQPPSSQRTTLKGLLQSQKAEQTARQSQSQLRPAATTPPKRRSVYDPPSSIESESGSDSSSDSDDGDSNQGDIMPDGIPGKMRKPWSK